MLHLILAETALEVVPPSISNHPSVVSRAKQLDRAPDQILLDRSFHHSAMRNIPDAGKRGRPDLAHFALLEATSTPLYHSGLLRVYVHTISDYVIELGDRVRLPRSYFRFEGLMMQLYEKGNLASGSNELIRMAKIDFMKLLEKIRASPTIGLSRRGRPSNYQKVAKRLSEKNEPALVVGGFPRGTFSSNILSHLDEVLAVDTMALDTNLVIARVLYEYENIVSRNT